MRLHTNRRPLVGLALIGMLATVLTVAMSCQANQGGEPAQNVLSDPILRIVDSARWAQNAHNIQSWRLWRLDPVTVWGGLDPDRLLPATDPLDRQLILSLGAFTEAVRIAAGTEHLNLSQRWIARLDWSPTADPGIPVFEWRFASTMAGTDPADETPSDVKIDALSRASVKYRVIGMRLTEGFSDGAVAPVHRPG